MNRGSDAITAGERAVKADPANPEANWILGNLYANMIERPTARSEDRLAYPARHRYVISVAATTADGCLAEYSNDGTGLDVSAPGGGNDADLTDNAWDTAHCNPNNTAREIFQETFTHGVTHFGLVGYEGTSEATPHVTAIAALIIATRTAGAHPTPDQVAARIESTARDIGAPGADSRYGAGLADAAAAITP